MKINKTIIKKQKINTSGKKVKKFLNEFKIVSKEKNKKNLNIKDIVEDKKETSSSLNPPPHSNSHIVFNGDMRNTFIREILCSFKNYFEEYGVYVEYERKDYADGRFGYKVKVEKYVPHADSDMVSYKQMFLEIKDAARNLINYIFNGESFEVSSNSDEDCIEFEIVSNY